MAPPLSDRVALQSRIYALDENMHGIVIGLTVLSIDYSPVLQLENGHRKMYCGTTLPRICQYVSLFLETLIGNGESDAGIAAFKTAWLGQNSEQRRIFHEGLVAAKAQGAAASYLAEVKKALIT